MASTTIPAVKAALITLFESIDALSGVDIAYSERAERRNNSVWLGDVDLNDIEVGSFRAGTYRRNEEWSIEVMVESVKPTAVAAETQGFTYLSAIEEALAADPKLSDVPGLLWVRADSISSTLVDVGGEGYLSRITLELSVRGTFI